MDTNSTNVTKRTGGTDFPSPKRADLMGDVRFLLESRALSDKSSPFVPFV